LRDPAGHLAPKIPPSLLAESDYVFESGFLPKDASSIYNERNVGNL